MKIKSISIFFLILVSVAPSPSWMMNMAPTSPIQIKRITNQLFIISGNQQLLDMAQNMSWPGAGTFDDPIIISNSEFFYDNYGGTTAWSFFKTTLYVRFENVVFRTTETTNFEAMFWAIASKHIEFNNTKFIGPVNGAALRINADGFADQSTPISIHDSYFDTSPWAIDVFEAHDVSIIKNTIGATSGVFILRTENVTVEKNWIVSNQYGIYASESFGTNIVGNSISSTNKGIWGNLLELPTVNENSIRTKIGRGISLSSTDYAEIDSNIVHSPTISISAYSSSNYTLTNNDLHGGGIGINFDNKIYWPLNVSGNTLNGLNVLYDIGGRTSDKGGVYSQAFLIETKNVAFKIDGRGIEDTAVTIMHSDNIQITGGNISKAFTGIEIFNSSRISISDLDIRHVYEGIAVSQSTYISIQNVFFENIQDSAISFYNVNYSEIFQNILYDGSFYYAYKGNNVLIRHNVLIGNNLDDLISSSYSKSVKILGNYFDNGETAISSNEVDALSIYGNTILDMSTFALTLYNTYNVSISKNYLSTFGFGILLYSIVNLTFFDNLLDAYLGNGLYGSYIDMALVSRNIFRGDGGMDFYSVTNSSIYRNIFDTNGLQPIIDLMDVDIEIAENDFYGNSTNFIKQDQSDVIVHNNFWEPWRSPDVDANGIVDLPFDAGSNITDPKPMVNPNLDIIFTTIVTPVSNEIKLKENNGSVTVWHLQTSFPSLYEIYLNGSIFSSGLLNSSISSISLNITDLNPGIYVFSLWMFLGSQVFVSTIVLYLNASLSTPLTTTVIISTVISKTTITTTISTEMGTMNKSSIVTTSTSSSPLPLIAVFILLPTVIFFRRKKSLNKKP